VEGGGGAQEGVREIKRNHRTWIPDALGSWMLVAHTCNPSYSGGRDQEDRGSKPAQANSSKRPYLEKLFTKIELVEWLKVKALSSSPSPETNKPRCLGEGGGGGPVRCHGVVKTKGGSGLAICSPR
jgi:hypothetical protein